MTASFSPAMQAALDRYDVPALPDGFADRLVARATAEAALEPAASKRKGSASPWRRASRIIGSAGIFGFFSATAAAMGLFGEPVEIPVISDVARQFDMIEERPAIPRAVAAENMQAPAERETGADGAAADEDTAAMTASERLQRLAADPRFRKLTPAQKRRAIRRAAKRMIDTGEATPADIRAALSDVRRGRQAAADKPARRAALRQRIRNATPEQKARLRERFETLPPEKQAAIRERLDIARSAQSAAESDSTDTQAEKPEAGPVEPAETAPTDAAATSTVAPPAITPEQREKLRERYRNATPEQRAAARERIRARREQAKAKARTSVRERHTKIRRRRN